MKLYCLHCVLGRLVTLLGYRLREKDVQVSLAVSQGLFVIGQGLALCRTVRNFLVNCIDYADSGSTLKLSILHLPGWYEVEIMSLVFCRAEQKVLKLRLLRTPLTGLAQGFLEGAWDENF